MTTLHADPHLLDTRRSTTEPRQRLAQRWARWLALRVGAWRGERHLATNRAATKWQLLVPHGHLQRFDDARGLRLRCVSGCLWLTIDGDAADRVLEAGMSFEPTERRPVLAYAIEDAVLRVEQR